MKVDESANLDITELFSYISPHDDSWRVSHKPFPVFWKNRGLYIEGVRLRESNDNTLFEEPCYFKVEPE